MKAFNLVLAVFVSFLFATNMDAQQSERKLLPTFYKGQLTIAGGVGVLPLGIGKGEIVGNPTLILDYGIKNSTSIGGFFIPTYETTQRELGTIYQRTKFATGVRVLGHISKYKFWDIYGGLQVGAVITTKESILMDDLKSTDTYRLPSSYNGSLIFSPVLGCKFQAPKHRYGAFIELGFNGTSFGTMGLSYRI